MSGTARRFIGQLAAAALTVAMPTIGAGQGKLMIYPARGQSQAQLEDDRYECHLQAVERSGFDPSFPPPDIPTAPISVPVPDNPKEGATAKGAAAGALVGAAIGKNNRDTVGGAIAGAIVGSAVGSAIEAKGESEAREQAEGQAHEQADARSQRRKDLERRRDAYRRAIQACLESRGYSVR